jgi:hypothetical protein
MATLLARIQLKYGQAALFNEVMSHLVPVMERNGWKLLGAYQTQIGRLWEVWDLWEVDDANHVRGVLAESQKDAEFLEWASRLPECVESEELRFLTKLPYAH